MSNPIININFSFGNQNSNERRNTENEDTKEDTEPKAITQSRELGGENSKEISIEEANAQLQSDDPWLQRKMAEQKDKTQ